MRFHPYMLASMFSLIVPVRTARPVSRGRAHFGVGLPGSTGRLVLDLYQAFNDEFFFSTDRVTWEMYQGEDAHLAVDADHVGAVSWHMVDLDTDVQYLITLLPDGTGEVINLGRIVPVVEV